MNGNLTNQQWGNQQAKILVCTLKVPEWMPKQVACMKTLVMPVLSHFTPLIVDATIKGLPFLHGAN